MRWLIVCLTGLAVMACFVGSSPASEDAASGKEEPGVKIEWYGQACFAVTSTSGARIVLDPFDPEKLSYLLPEGPVTLVFSSHDHFDHNNVNGVKARIVAKGGKGGAMVTEPLKFVRGYQSYVFEEGEKTYKVTFVPSYHDMKRGDDRGLNTISVWEIDEVRIVHLGDLGTTLDEKQREAIGRPDVLLVPVGGYFTIDAEGARKVVKQLSPRIVVPMHYKTEALGARLPISGVEAFLKGWKDVEKAGGSTLTVTPGKLPEGPKVIVLKWHGAK